MATLQMKKHMGLYFEIKNIDRWLYKTKTSKIQRDIK